MDQYLIRMIGCDKRIAVGRRLSQPCSNGEDQVGILDPFNQFGVGAIAQVPGVDRASIVDCILSPERCRDGQADSYRKFRKMVRCTRVPSGAADDGNGRNRILEQRHDLFHGRPVRVLFGR